MTQAPKFTLPVLFNFAAAAAATWARDVPKDKEIAVYCVYGHEVG